MRRPRTPVGKVRRTPSSSSRKQAAPRPIKSSVVQETQFRDVLKATGGDKKDALKLFWKTASMPGRLAAWVEPKASREALHDVLLLPPPAGKPGALQPDRDAGAGASLAASISAQFAKEHLHALRRHLLSVCLRPAADGKWVILVQLPSPGEALWKAMKSFGEFLHRNHPEVIALHALSSTPRQIYDPTHPPTSARLRLREVFGPTVITAPDGGVRHQVLDWMPTRRSLLQELPEALADQIHPRKGDCLLWLCSGCGPIALGLSRHFTETTMVDARSITMESILSSRLPSNVRFERALADGEYIQQFFADRKDRGMWTVVLDPPADQPLPAGLITALARARPARVIHLLDNAKFSVAETRRWRRHGYLLRKSVPLDDGPGSDAFTLALILAPDREGVLREGRKASHKEIQPQEESASVPRFVQRKRVES